MKSKGLVDDEEWMFLLTGGVMTMLSDAAPTSERHYLSSMVCAAMGGAEPEGACSAL